MLLRTAFARIIILITALLMISCSQMPKALVENSNIYWPEQPENARIRHLLTFSTPAEVGITRGFFEKIVDFFAGEKIQRLVRPMSVVVTDSGQIYVADPGVKGVHRFDINESKYEVIFRDGDRIFPSPVALALGPNNSVYVVDSELRQLYQIKPSNDVAKIVNPQLKLKQPTGIAYSKLTNQIYITDTAQHLIKIMNENGEVQTVFGKRGTSESEFNFPTYLTLDEDNNLYVTDSLNFRVQVFDKNGHFQNMFGKAGDSSGNFSRPKGIAVARNKHLFIVDALFNSVQVFNKEGKLLLYFGTQGNRDGEFWLPTGVFIKDDKIYVADTHNQRVQVFLLLGGNQ